MVQATAVIGQAGQLATAIPVAWLLADAGWSTTFLTLGALGAVAAAAVYALVGAGRTSGIPSHADVVTEDAPASAPPDGPQHTAPLHTVSRPGVWLGFWTHFTSLFSANTIALLWGVPFFTSAQGLTKVQASGLLTVLTLTKFVVAPIVGSLTARHPLRRSWLVLAFAGVTAAAWIALLLPSTPRPQWQLVVFCVVIAAGGPVSLVGVDYARTFAAPERLGVATGIANMGGFVSTIVAVGLVGVVLDLASTGSTYDLDAYRLAFTALVIPWGIGVAGVLVTRRRARADWARDGIVVPPLRVALGRYRRR
jgi:MFS family permease